MKTYRQVINESYDSRVRAVADAVMAGKMNPTPSTIESHARHLGVTEIRMPQHRARFINDVKKLLPRATPERKPGKWNDDVLRQIARKFENAAGMYFPDGDPIDAMIPYYRRMGWQTHEMGPILDRAVRKYLGMKSANHYLHSIWDQFAADNPGHEILRGRPANPWPKR